jgi:hypothetical protein
MGRQHQTRPTPTRVAHTHQTHRPTTRRPRLHLAREPRGRRLPRLPRRHLRPSRQVRRTRRRRRPRQRPTRPQPHQRTHPLLVAPRPTLQRTRQRSTHTHQHQETTRTTPRPPALTHPFSPTPSATPNGPPGGPLPLPTPRTPGSCWASRCVQVWDSRPGARFPEAEASNRVLVGVWATRFDPRWQQPTTEPLTEPGPTLMLVTALETYAPGRLGSCSGGLATSAGVTCR